MATEKRLIDANALESYLWVLFKFFGSLPCSEADKTTQRAIKRCIGEVKKMPTVDAVKVVRCKECAYSTGTAKFCPLYRDGLMKDDDYCSVARRK